MASHASNSTKTFRVVSLLQSIPREPRKITTTELLHKLQAEGHDIDKRSVERYLSELLESHEWGGLLLCDDRSRPFGWSFRKDAMVSLPGMDASMAVTLDLVRRYMVGLLPGSVKDKLAPMFREADNWLKANKPAKSRPWPKKVAYVPRGMHLLPAQVKPQVLDQVYEGLYKNRQLQIRYKDREEDILLHPVALVDRGPVRYLLAMCWDYTDLRHFALHRMESVTALEQSARAPRGFDLDEYIRAGNLDLPSGKEINLELKFYGRAGLHLEETPLTNDQQIKVDDEGNRIVRAKVEETEELRWWILGFGQHVEVLKPARLRKKISADLLGALARYQ